MEDDADFQVTVDAIPINAPTNETNEKKKQRKKKANRGSKKSEVTEKVEEEAAEVESEDDENHENGADADNVEEEDFEETEWLKLGVPELVVKALKEMKFNTPTTIQVCSHISSFCFHYINTKYPVYGLLNFLIHFAEYDPSSSNSWKERHRRRSRDWKWKNIGICNTYN